MGKIDFNLFLNEDIMKREESDDYLFDAYDEPIVSKAKKLAKKALEIYPDNIDALNFITKFETNTLKKLEKYKKTLDRAKAIIEEDDLFNKENIGEFWGIIETRPYMRTKHSYMLTLMELGRYTEAVNEGEDLLKLCESDSQGIRYLIIGLYAVLENFKMCEKLYNKFGDDSVFMTLPLAIMYYKSGNYNKCKKVLREMNEENCYVLDYLTGRLKFSKVKIEEMEMDKMYSYGSKEEAYFVLNGNRYLLGTVPTFVEFIEREIIEKS